MGPGEDGGRGSRVAQWVYEAGHAGHGVFPPPESPPPGGVLAPPCQSASVAVGSPGGVVLPQVPWGGDACWVADLPTHTLAVAVTLEAAPGGPGAPCVAGLELGAGPRATVRASEDPSCDREAAEAVAGAARDLCGLLPVTWGSPPRLRAPAAGLVPHVAAPQRDLEVVVTLALAPDVRPRTVDRRRPQEERHVRECEAAAGVLGGADVGALVRGALRGLDGEEVFPRVSLTARTVSVPAMGAAKGAAELQAALEAAGALAGAGGVPPGPRSRVVHHVLVVQSCEPEYEVAEAVVDDPAGDGDAPSTCPVPVEPPAWRGPLSPAIALPGGEGAPPDSMVTPQGDVITVTGVGDARAHLEGGKFASLVRQTVRAHLGLPTSYPRLGALCAAAGGPGAEGAEEGAAGAGAGAGGRGAGGGADALAACAGGGRGALLFPWEREALGVAARGRSLAMGAQGVYAVASLVGRSTAFSMGREQRGAVAGGLAVLESAAPLRAAGAAAEELASLGVDDRVRYHSQWGLSAKLQLYMLGLWPLLVSVVRPFAGAL